MERNLFGRNGLLRAIEPDLRPAVAKKLSLVELARGETLYLPGTPLERVYFPVRGLVGILAETADGECMDTSIVGQEGAIGLFEACGSRLFLAEAAVQVGGQAAVMTAAAYRDLFGVSLSMRNASHRYVEQLMSETRQAVLCNALHEVEARLSRIILEGLERSGASDVLALTQETLARMLGAQRTTIAEILSRLQREAVLSTRRGAVMVRDRPRLESLACSCRASISEARATIWNAAEPSCEANLAAE